MPICIECRYPVRQLYTSYSKADDRALGKGVRLTQCPRCKRFADKYVEHDFVVQFIDLVLIKPQVYRHLLFNRLGREDDRFDPSIIRFAILLLLFDVYLTWARIEKLYSSTVSVEGVVPKEDTGIASIEPLSHQPLVLQYIFFLLLCTLRTLAFHLPIRFLTSVRWPSSVSIVLPYYPHRARVSTALIVSSCTKLFPILLIVWDYDLPSSASAINWAVLINNIAALEILMDCGYVRAAVLTLIGSFTRLLVGGLILDLFRSRSSGFDGQHSFNRLSSFFILQN